MRIATAALRKNLRIIRTPEDASKLSQQALERMAISGKHGTPVILVIQHFERAKPPAEGNLMLRLDMLIAKNRDLFLHEDIDNLIKETLVDVL
jgi:hypothetical protein